MTEPATPGVPEAKPKRGIWPGLVWAVPLAALIIVVFLGLRSFANRGINIIVTFDTASGIKVDDTKVLYEGYEVGHVVKIDVDNDVKHIDLTLRMDHRAEPVLKTGTTFWLIGDKPSLADLSSVKAAVTGLIIGVSPSWTGQPTRRFQGLSEQPVVMPGTPGTPYTLTGDRLGVVRRGSSVLYRGQEIGKVTGVALKAPEAFEVYIFVFQPFDAMIRSGSRFWTASPLRVSLAGGSVDARVDTGVLFSGGVEMELPDSATAAVSAPDSRFILYKDRDDAMLGPPGPQVLYSLNFPGAGGDLTEGAPVMLLGFQVGEVKSFNLRFDPSTGAPSTTAIAALDALKLHVDPPVNPADPASWRAPTDRAITRLLAQGYRARLMQKPPLIGGRAISLDPVKDGTPAALGAGDPAEIPSAEVSGDIADLTGKADQILAKINGIPFDSIGRDIHQITSRLSSLVSSPQVTDSLKHLDSTLANVDQMMAEVKPKVGPLVTQLNKAADEIAGTAAAAHGMLSGEGAPQGAAVPDAIRELTDAARSIHSLADYLGRHPEAVINGKGNSE